jgi:hypothetical protein
VEHSSCKGRIPYQGGQNIVLVLVFKEISFSGEIRNNGRSDNDYTIVAFMSSTPNSGCLHLRKNAGASIFPHLPVLLHGPSM